MVNYIDITGCDLTTLVKKAYDLSVPQGMGVLHAHTGGLSDEDAHKIVDAGNDRWIRADYVYGRAVKLSVLRKDGRLMIRPKWHDHTHEQLRELLQSIGKTIPENTMDCKIYS